MPSSILKSFAITASFLASPAVAQIGNWDIIYQSLLTDFQNSVADEFTIDYLIGTGRTFNIELFDKGCNDPITGITITPTPLRTNGVTPDHDLLEVMLDLDKTDITTSNIWDSGSNKLEFCIAVQLMSGVSVIKEE